MLHSAVKITVLLFSLLVSIVVERGFTYSVHCPCNFGGLCLDRHVPIDSCKCDTIAKDIYEDCTTLKNHCQDAPCKNGGTCVPIVGGFFCNCKSNFYGQKCEFEGRKLINQEMFIYYQVQPAPDHDPFFVVIYDPKEKQDLRKYSKRSVFSIFVSDGRAYYPQRELQMERKNWKKICLKSAQEFPDYYDETVCNFLPDREEWSFEFSAVLSTPLDVDVDNTVYNHGTLVGRTGTVEIGVILYTGDTEQLILNYRITVFNYYVSRVRNNCLIEFKFRGCSSNHKFPREEARSKKIRIIPFIRKVNCTGTLTVGYRWSLQKHIDDSTKRDIEPTRITDFDNQRDIVFPSRYLMRGKHLIELKLLLKGDPPSYGGATEFSKIGRCWITIKLGPVSVRVKHGRSFTASCYTPLTLNFVTSNPSYFVSEFQFFISCDQTEDDPECAERTLLVPFYTKLKTPCEKTYLFRIRIQSKVSEGPNSHQEIYSEVQFVKSEMATHFECQFNCYPIDPQLRVIAYVRSIPYFPDDVNWIIKLEGREITERDGLIYAFYPLKASRLVRVNGYRFTEPGKVQSKVKFEARGIHDHFVVSDTHSDHLQPYMENFTVQAVSEKHSEYRYISKGDLQRYVYHPILYRIYQVNSYTRSCLVILETNHPSILDFSAEWNSVLLCIIDSRRSQACTGTTTIEHTIKTEISMSMLREKIENGDVSRFLTYTVLYLFNGLTSASEPLRWKIDIQTRTELLGLLLKPEETRNRDLAVVANAISMICFSKEGNEAEELHPFIDEINEDSDFEAMLSWMEMRKAAMKVFVKACHVLFTLGGRGLSVLLKYGYGDAVDELFHTWSLAHVQSNFVNDFQDNIHSTYEDFLSAELNSLERSINKLITTGLHELMKGMARVTPIFYGLRTFGKKNTHAWIITTSYRGILVALNESFVKDPKENLDGFTDNIFGPPHDVKEWFEYMKLQMPEYSQELDSDEFSMVILLAKNRPEDITVSPFLYVRLIRKGGVVMKRMPHSQVFSITFPKMVKGEVIDTKTSNIFGSFPLVKAKTESLKYHHYSVYKVSLPAEYLSWTEFIYLNELTALKVKFKFDSVPDYEEVESMPELKFEYDEHVKRYKATAIVMKPHNQPLNMFYVGLIFSKKVPPGTHVTVFHHSDVNVCIAHETDGSDYEENCQGTKSDRIDVVYVKCQCKMFGLIFVKSSAIQRTRMFMDAITYIAPEKASHDETEVIPTVLAFLIIFTVVVAIFVDRSRQKIDLIYSEDAYPGDKNLLVVGVYTSVRLLAGTSSSVAIKIIGVDSSSRVHILRTRRKKTLKMGHDDWFVITTKHPLGTITEIIIWHNFHRLSDWHCSQIYVYDLSIAKWYHVTIERWFCIQPSMDESKMVSFKVKEIESVDGVFLSLPYKFSTHYINELRNCHVLISLFYLRRRSLTSVEHRCYVMLIKLLAMCFMAWFVEQYLTILVYGRVLDPEAARGLLTLDAYTILLAFAIVIFSAPFTLPIQLTFRSNYKSRLLQKKITNPIYIQLAKPEDLVTTSQHAKTDDAPVTSQVKKVGFRLTDSDVQPLRRVTRLLSNVIQKRIAWTKTKKASLGKNWKKVFLTFFGPAQFRCVNISCDTFKIKTRRRILKIRIFAAFEMVLLLLSMFLILSLTNIYNELEVVGFLLLLAILTDIIILDPMNIFFHSLWMFYTLETSNKESYLWNEDTKLHPPTPLEFVQYSKVATKKEYKPLVTADIEKKIKRQQTVSKVKSSLFYGCSSFAIICATFMLDHDYSNQHYYTAKGMAWQIAEPENHLRRPSYHVDEIDCPKKVADYIATSLAAFVKTWYNKKNISQYHHGRWARDLVSKPIGATKMVMLFTPRGAGSVRVTKTFADYFEYSAGYITEDSLATDEVTLGGNKLNCMNKSEGWIIGKTHDYYPIRGHNLTLPLVDFKKYYSNLINVLNDLIDQMDVHIPRAIIYTTNYINSFARRIITVDVIHEFLPSGVSTAKIHIDTIPAYEQDQWTHETFKFLLLFLIFIHFIVTLNEVVKHKNGIISYFLSLNGILKLLIYPLCIALAVLTLNDEKEETIDAIIHLSDYEYINLHPIFDQTVYEAVLVLTILSALILDLFFAIWRRCGYDRLKQTMTTRCIHLCCGLFLLQLFVFLDLNVCANSMDSKVSSLELSLLLKEGNTIETDYNHFLLIVIYCTLFVFQKTTAAVFLANYFIVERQMHQESTLKHALKAMRLFPKKTSINKVRNLESKSESPKKSGEMDRSASGESSHSYRTQQPKKYNIFW